MSQSVLYINSIVFGTLLRAADEIGLPPMLLARQTAKVLAVQLAGIQKQMGIKPHKTFEEFIEFFKNQMKDTPEMADPEKTEITLDGNTINERIVNCLYLSNMSQYAKTLGYQTCPICVSAVLMMASLNAQGICGEFTDFKTETKGDTCFIKLEIREKTPALEK
ncbi:MAG: hypothetical protein ACETWM_13260 [Candidatus Lokiarchaeia archaeon]